MRGNMKPEVIDRWCAVLDEVKDLLRETFTEQEDYPEPVEREPEPEPDVPRETIVSRRGLTPTKGNLRTCEVCKRPIPSRAYELHLKNCSQASRGEFDERSILVGGR